MKVLLLDVSVFSYQGFRLPQCIAEMGCEVFAICRPSALINQSLYIKKIMRGGLNDDNTVDVKQFVEALINCDAHVVIPLNDESRRLLYQVSLLSLAQQPGVKEKFTELLARSIYDLASAEQLDKRLALSDICKKLSLRTPAFTGDLSTDAIRDFQQKLEPKPNASFVIKLDGTDAGNGVTYYADVAEYTASPTTPSGIAQQFIEGQVCMLGFSAYQGRYLAGICAQKVQSLKSAFGQSTVVKSIHCPEIISAAKKLVQFLGYTGFGSLDFILDAQGKAHIIELNQRITKLSHLGNYFGQDPLTAFLQCVNGSEVNVPSAKLDVVVASFPYEWSRQPNSPYLNGLVDVPWAEAKMMEVIMKRIMPKSIKFE